MPRPNRVHLRVLTLLLIAALALPSFALAAPAPLVDAAPDLPLRDALTAHMTPERQQLAFQQTVAALDAWSDQIEQRPPVDPAVQMQQTADWTVLVYIAGDNNLEAMGLLDLNEMEAVGSSPDVNIVAQIDRSTEFSTWDGDWTGARRYLVQQGQNPEIVETEALQDLGAINSGDPASLVDFAVWGITTFPAEKYMLVMWDHGGAWSGHASDDETGDDLDMPELRDALEQIVTDTGIGQFEVVGFDMCLMGQLEVFQTIAPYARYGIGSEENEPGAGWYYVWLNELVKNPAMTGAELTPVVVDYYMGFYEEVMPKISDVHGLSAVDLSQTDALVSAVEGFTRVVNRNPQAALSAIADARNNTISYGGFDDPRYFDVWSSVDLYHFAELLNGISTSPEMQQAAQGVMQAVDSFVLHELHTPRLDNSYGVSIFFPRNFKAYKIAAFNARYPVESPSSMAHWAEFLDVFHGTAVATVTEAPVVNVLNVYPETVSIYQPAVVPLEISGRDILQVNYAVTYIINENERVVLDFDYLVSRTTTATGADIVDWSDGVTQRTFTWEAEVPILTDGFATSYALLIPSRDDPDVALVNGEYQSSQGGAPVEAQLIFDLNAQQATQMWGFVESGSGTLQPFEIQVVAGDTFKPQWLTMDANNELVGTSFGQSLALDPANPITFRKTPAPSGTYSISFVAENVAGERTLDEAIIQVSNDGLDESLRGYTDLTYGVNFLYPATWIRPRFTPDGLRLFTADLETNTILSLFPYTDVASAEATAQAVRASWNQLQNLQVLNERQIEINGVPAYVIDYSYSFQGEERLGAVVAIYSPDQNVGYGFDLDAPAASPGPAEQALAALVSSINFFQPAEVAGVSEWQTVNTPDGQASFPVPSNWVRETSGNWVMYGPADDKAIFIGVQSAAASGESKEALAQSWVSQLESGTENLQILASEPYYVGSHEWYLVVFTYDEAGTTLGGALFVNTIGAHDLTIWLEAPNNQFDALYAETFSVAVNGFALASEAAPAAE